MTSGDKISRVPAEEVLPWAVNVLLQLHRSTYGEVRRQMPRPRWQRWMSDKRLRAAFDAGLTYAQIARVNERSEGWRPSEVAVWRKREALGLPRRRGSRRDLLPWAIRAEHHNDRLRHMLHAESRRREGIPLSDKEKILTALLRELLFGRGAFMVVGYHPELGFYLVERKDSDIDIIRYAGLADSDDDDSQA